MGTLIWVTARTRLGATALLYPDSSI